MNLTFVWRAVMHRVEGVEQQIQRNLLELHLVAPHRRQVGINFERDMNVV